MKRFIAIVTMIVPMILISINAQALGQLSKYELPKVEELKKPVLSKDYQKMKDGMDQEWKDTKKTKGNTAFDANSAYIDSMKSATAYKLFTEKYSKDWEAKKKEFSKSIESPSAQYFKSYLNTLSQNGKDKIDTNRSIDKQEISKLLSKSLDTSHVWNLDSFRNSTTFMDSKQVNDFLGSSLKPSGWDEVKKNANKEMDPNFVDKMGFVQSIEDGLGEVTGFVKKYLGSGIGTDTNSNTSSIGDIINGFENKSNLTDEQLKKLKESATNQSQSFINPLK